MALLSNQFLGVMAFFWSRGSKGEILGYRGQDAPLPASPSRLYCGVEDFEELQCSDVQCYQYLLPPPTSYAPSSALGSGAQRRFRFRPFALCSARTREKDIKTCCSDDLADSDEGSDEGMALTRGVLACIAQPVSIVSASNIFVSVGSHFQRSKDCRSSFFFFFFFFF
ncbi:hypothetical protein GGS24DRAFT_279617 [Hypoxylon argillaceum]|nr:hypothetical protein GGS24DRAFT_279617 [Hypoxylon argillaceum]